MGLQLSPLQAMQLALSEARKGWGGTRPNPNVGCVILSPEGSLISAGHHEKVGGPHAEINALKNVPPERLKGATVVVTLEPCSFEGRTGSCAKALATLPIREVIYGLVDPNPKVSGKGLEILTAAGIKVSSLRESLRHGEEDLFDSVKSKLEEVAEHFLWNQRKKLPFVALKVATTSDGAMSLKGGAPRGISSSNALEEVHRLRAGFAAMLVGKNTFLADNPSLNVRHSQFPEMQNKAIVLDRSGSALEKLKDSNLYNSHSPADIFWIVDQDKFSHQKLANDLGIHIVHGPVSEALPRLLALGVDSIMVEGGAETLKYFIENKLAQRLYHFVSPKVAGDQAETIWTSRLELSWDMRSQFGEDTLLSGKFL